MGVTGIAWADWTWNPWVGCTRVSEGCANCYMYREQQRYGGTPAILRRTKGEKRDLPLRKKRDGSWKIPPGSFVFVCSWSDFFHPDADEWRDEAFGIMGARPDLTFLVLTKRPEFARKYLEVEDARPEDWGAGLAKVLDKPGLPRATRRHVEQAVCWLFGEWCDDERPEPPFDKLPVPFVGLPNVWLGVTAENQKWADARLYDLLALDWPGKRFVSIEPQVGAVDLRTCQTDVVEFNALTGDHGVLRPHRGRSERKLDWVICGGESGANHRPFNLDWARSLRDQCVEAGVPFFLKQYSGVKPAHMPELDGRTWGQRPGASEKTSAMA